MALPVQVSFMRISLTSLRFSYAANVATVSEVREPDVYRESSKCFLCSRHDEVYQPLTTCACDLGVKDWRNMFVQPIAVFS